MSELKELAEKIGKINDRLLIVETKLDDMKKSLSYLQTIMAAGVLIVVFSAVVKGLITLK